MLARRALAPDPDRPVGLVLPGGGARGAVQVGGWQVLRELYAAGQEAARAWLARGPELDSRRRLE